MRGDGRIFARKGSSVLWCAYYVRGKEIRESTGETDQKKAQKYLDGRIKHVHADQVGAKPFVGPKAEKLTVGDLLDALESKYKVQGQDSPQNLSTIKRAREDFGTRRAVALTAADIRKYRDDRRESGAAPATINRVLQAVRAAFNLAVKENTLATKPYFELLSERDNVRKGFFEAPEVAAIRASVPAHIADFIQFAHLTGWRKGEIASLRWSDVDAEAITLRAENAKNGHARSIPLEGELAALVEHRRKMRKETRKGVTTLSEYVFHHHGNPIAAFRKTWEKACVINGLGTFYCRTCRDADGGYTFVLDAERKCSHCGQVCERPKYIGRIFHDLRRSQARDSVRSGTPVFVAAAMTGHRTLSMFQRYNITDERDMRKALQQLQQYRAQQLQKVVAVN